MTKSGSNKKVANSVVALSSAAVLAVYSAGYVRTRSAAGRFAERPAAPMPARRIPPRAELSNANFPTLPAPPLPASPPSEPTVAEVAAPGVKTSSQPAAVPKAAHVAAPAPSSAAAPAASPSPATLVAEVKPELPAAAPVAPVQTVWKDGKYVGWGTCRHGDIQATVVIEGGRIASATISECLTRYSCDVIEKLPPQVAQRQSPEIDHVSGATQSADAFYWAVVGALKLAQ